VCPGRCRRAGIDAVGADVYGVHMHARATRLLPVLALLGAAVIALSGCMPDGGTPSPATPRPTAPSPVESRTPDAAASPSPTAVAARVPTDCKAILTADVLAQLGTTPLNDPAMGPSGTRPDGSLVCIWRDPRADTTGLATTISRVDRGPALDMLNGLVATQGFQCYTPDDGTRCEKTWVDDKYPVNDGRTLFWRDGVMIDTQYSNLAPTGYTASIIAAVFG